MKQEKKSALSRQRILNAALEEFANNGYRGASLNRVCQEKNISKGMIYHYFQDKDELYLLCVEKCFDGLTLYLNATWERHDNRIEEMLKKYFDARLKFFAENPMYLEIFLDAVLNTPEHLKSKIGKIKNSFDETNICILKDMLKTASLRKGLDIGTVAEDFRMYMTFFNLAFKNLLDEGTSGEDALKQHEKRIHRQLDIMLYGILERDN